MIRQKDKIYPKEYIEADAKFYNVDRQNDRVKVVLSYPSPKDLFDNTEVTATPKIANDFYDKLKDVLDTFSSKTKVDVTLTFDESAGFSEDDLKNVFKDNLYLLGKKSFNKVRQRNKAGYLLLVLGVALLTNMLLINFLWKDGGIAKEIFSYVFDILTTVCIWQAITILVTDSGERLNYGGSLLRKIGDINFVIKDKE